MGEHTEFRAGMAGSIHDGGVDEFIENDDIVIARHGANRAEGGGIASGEGQRGFSAFECCEGLIKLMINRKRATY